MSSQESGQPPYGGGAARPLEPGSGPELPTSEVGPVPPAPPGSQPPAPPGPVPPVATELPERPPTPEELAAIRRAKHRSWLSLAIEVAVLFLIALVIAIFLQAFAIKAFEIPSPSMEPTLMEGDKVLVDRASYHFSTPNRGDIIVFRFDPNDPANLTQGTNFLSRGLDLLAETMNITHQEGSPFIKRVIGLPGETLEMKDGTVYINGEALQENYKYVKDSYTGGPWVVPDKCVFVMGDNRPNSNDSRRWGFVPYGTIMGRGIAIWWPPSRWSGLH